METLAALCQRKHPLLVAWVGHFPTAGSKPEIAAVSFVETKAASPVRPATVRARCFQVKVAVHQWVFLCYPYIKTTRISCKFPFFLPLPCVVLAGGIIFFLKYIHKSSGNSRSRSPSSSKDSIFASRKNAGWKGDWRVGLSIYLSIWQIYKLIYYLTKYITNS